MSKKQNNQQNKTVEKVETPNQAAEQNTGTQDGQAPGAEQEAAAQAQTGVEGNESAPATDATGGAAEQTGDQDLQEGQDTPGAPPAEDKVSEPEAPSVEDQASPESQAEAKAIEKADAAPEQKQAIVIDDLIVAPIVNTPAAADAPAEKTEAKVATVVELPSFQSSNQALADRVANILKDVPAAYTIDIGRVFSYLETMAPKRQVDVNTGCNEQVALYKSIQNIVNRNELYFKPLFTALLVIFKENAQLSLNDRYRLRFMESVRMNSGDRQAFINLTHVLSLLADPQSRELSKTQLNFDKALGDGLTPDGRNRVLNYFEV